ncbi:hypothetical protein EMIHUDRAFT_350878 [Emiliania huxleyi CCMP1516]|uniref:Band 7 domain-containing protein n=2 Tax=Emiliania huxleyi TaxID=2903 RepID=A0A0D3I7K3_EMIH1|nr:hypothetical protein EMIHUDRAFT_350878 [Emiliania huxleyi CCMP1516]EOD07238.1 hypothetical protein EMIHUDRAFT_350878 [Emiliania huxleyi CCMP1516]|eukprot:XP_005759667.1 hypothetical protein EMIHUDRAFT_350878 [Emiliania huxleyi CCMP1516]
MASVLGRLGSVARMGGSLLGKVVFTRSAAAFGAGALTAMPMMSGEDFFYYSFITDKDPDAIIDFYSTEDFLQILGIFPFALHFVLAGVVWDLEKENTNTVYQSMEISFTLEEEEDDDGVVGFFQKRERFKNFIPLTSFLLWDQVQCYGYKRREDETVEVFHRVEARYVIWATERHINSRLRDGTPHAERALARLEKMARLDAEALNNEEASLSTIRKANLKRYMSKVEVANPESQKAIDGALASLSKTSEGQKAMGAAFQELLAHPEMKAQVETLEPRYGGIFKMRQVEGLEIGEKEEVDA